VGAGTGFLSLALARLGYEVTALDVSPRMLTKLDAAARRQRLTVRTVEGRADAPPAGPFAAVVERLLLWTLPDPAGTVARWRTVAPGGRLLAFEGVWGAADRVEGLRERVRERWYRWQRRPPEHHGSYTPDLSAQLPLDATAPAEVVEIVERAGWETACLERLRDVEWAIALALPPTGRLLGVTPQFLVSAQDRR
jgi:SAM-dependent methyltransferase